MQVITLLELASRRTVNCNVYTVISMQKLVDHRCTGSGRQQAKEPNLLYGARAQLGI